jgi:dihydroxy-acid dehydratase
LAKGVRDMVRISDARMSGTAYGTVVLHAAPEAAAGGPLGKVRTGDPIVLDVPNRTLMVDVPDLDDRPVAEAAVAAFATPTRGWQRMYTEHVLQADEGADLDFLRGATTQPPTRESH